MFDNDGIEQKKIGYFPITAESGTESGDTILISRPFDSFDDASGQVRSERARRGNKKKKAGIRLR